jgi:hypothetical protein
MVYDFRLIPNLTFTRMEMRRLLVPLSLAAIACHTDSAVAPVNTSATDAKNMVVGETRVLTPSAVPNGIELSGAASTSDYLVVVANANPVLDVQSSYTVRGDLFAGDAARASNLESSGMVAVTPDDGNAAQEAADSHIRSFERAHLVPARASAVASGARNLLGMSGAVVVGQSLNINVPNENSSDLCKNFFPTTGTVKSVSRRAIIVMDNNANQSAFSQADFDAIAAEFDNTTYPTDSSYFGNPTDIDQNTHVILYYTPEVNKLTQPAQSSFVAGFFFAGDFFSPTSTTNGCAQSNQGEIFYLLAPDPTGAFNNNIRSAATVRQGTRGTIAHEFQHMINAGNRIRSNAPAFESVWLDEGLAHTAEDAVGRAVRGFGDFQTLSDADLFGNGTPQATVDAYTAFFGQNLRRFSTWLSRPDTSSGLSKHADKNLSSRGAIWALLRWTGDHYSGGNFRAYTRKLAAGPDTGLKNLTGVAAEPLDTLLAGWLPTNYSDHFGIVGLPSIYNYVGYNMRDAVAHAGNGTYPLQVTTLASGAVVSTSSLSGSGTYYRVVVAANTPRTIKVQDGVGANVAFTGARFYVLRID